MGGWKEGREGEREGEGKKIKEPELGGHREGKLQCTGQCWREWKPIY